MEAKRFSSNGRLIIYGSNRVTQRAFLKYVSMLFGDGRDRRHMTPDLQIIGQARKDLDTAVVLGFNRKLFTNPAASQEGRRFRLFPRDHEGWVCRRRGWRSGCCLREGHIGYAELTQVSVGFRAGAQTYSELIVFEDQAAMNRFKQNELNFGANASSVLLEKGAAADARFVDELAVFVKPTDGVMAETSLGGQQITYMQK